MSWEIAAVENVNALNIVTELISTRLEIGEISRTWPSKTSSCLCLGNDDSEGLSRQHCPCLEVSFAVTLTPQKETIVVLKTLISKLKLEFRTSPKNYSFHLNLQWMSSSPNGHYPSHNPVIQDPSLWPFKSSRDRSISRPSSRTSVRTHSPSVSLDDPGKVGFILLSVSNLTTYRSRRAEPYVNAEA